MHSAPPIGQMSTVIGRLDRSAVRKRSLRFLVLLCLIASVGSCVVYEPVPVPGPYMIEKFDSVWDSALRAAEDTGIRIMSADRETGRIIGRTDRADVRINVLRQADGSTRVEVNFRSDQLSEQEISRLSDAFYRNYESYRGRR